jgi:hypothetical protein
MHVQPLVPWRSSLAWDIPSFGSAGQSITAACSVMLAGPALSALAIFHSSECAEVVNVPGGKGVVAVERSSCMFVEHLGFPLAEARFARGLDMYEIRIGLNSVSQRPVDSWMPDSYVWPGGRTRLVLLAGSQHWRCGVVFWRDGPLPRAARWRVIARRGAGVHGRPQLSCP